MMRCAVTISLTPEAQAGPFVFSQGLASGCEAAARLGFHGVELFPRSADEVSVPELKELLQQHQLRLAAVGTGAGWVVQKLRLTDPDPAVRRRAMAFAASIIDLAGGFNAPAIIGSMQGKAEQGATREEALGWLAEALEQLGPRAHAHGVPLLIEPLNRYETNLLNTVAGSLQFLEQLRTQNVKILCDLFHMNIEETRIGEALELAGAKLGHVHLADSNRRAAGFGHTDFIPIARKLQELGYGGFISAEIFPWPNPEAAARQTIASFRAVFEENAS